MALRSPIHELHKELGAGFTEFAGFEMPLQYKGLIAEHMAVRKGVGLFDVSHMSNVWVRGKDAEPLISKIMIADPKRFPVGKARYNAFCREDGTIIDDTIFLHMPEGFYVVPNAGMNEIAVEWFKKVRDENGFDAEIIDESRETVILAIQGPKAEATMQKVVEDLDLSTLKFFECSWAKVNGKRYVLSRTGYTGEDGFELHIKPMADAEKITRMILKAGEEFDLHCVGLGARDSLRLEKNLCLAGNEFEGGRSPVEAGINWTMDWEHDFVGKAAMLKQKEGNAYELLRPLLCTDKGIPRHGCEVYDGEELVGKVTSGGMSPCMKKGIALAYVKPGHREEGRALEIEVRGKRVPCAVIKGQFVKKSECAN
ncbi:MAG: glycine cleavage system protein T [Thermoplasmata archaeon HGW-Thermoplasmata-1]|nr:MAG: glycine cleavage system protein T [Thermoplasmata archaeon HGW-Thermoplasmata-1]